MSRKKLKNALRNLGVSLGFLSAAFGVCALLMRLGGDAQSSHLIFVLAVLMISRLTDGYAWGVLAALVSVVAVNFAFTYPFFAFNFTLSGYLVTFSVMLAVALTVSVLTTQNKRQEQARMDAQRERLRADLLRAVSHDLRTPLTSIVGSTGAILENDLPPDQQRELISETNADAQWLLSMVENLLTVTRFSDDSKPLQMRTEVVEEIVADAVIKFQKRFGGIQVDMITTDEVLFADMEPMLIGQVVTNLLENAAYHGGNVSVIRIKIGRYDGFVHVEVCDDGVGIPPERMKSLFTEDAVSARHRGADARKGMGIGLSVCMSIIKAHGGTMNAENSDEGGACFSFTLPEKEIDYADA